MHFTGTMNDQQAWRQALEEMSCWYRSLSAASRTALDAQIDRIMRLKEELLEAATATGSTELCRSCGGACCRHGKFYVTLLDLVAYQRCRVEPLIPAFGPSSSCPYGGAQGCRMEPRFRPMTCVIFNCETIDERIDRARYRQGGECEQELRSAIAEAERIAGTGLGRAALLAGTTAAASH